MLKGAFRNQTILRVSFVDQQNAKILTHLSKNPLGKIKHQVCKHKNMSGAQLDKQQQHILTLIVYWQEGLLQRCWLTWLTQQSRWYIYSDCLGAACVDLNKLLNSKLCRPNQPERRFSTLVVYSESIKSPLRLCACVSLWYAQLSACTDKLVMEQLVEHKIYSRVMFSLVIPSALPTFRWFRDSKAIVSVPPVSAPPFPPIPVTPPIVSLPLASVSIPTVTVAAAAVAIAVAVAVTISISMTIPVSVAILAAISIAPVAVAVLTVSVAPPVLPVSVAWAVSLRGRCRRREAVLWTGLTGGGHGAQGACTGEAHHGQGGTVKPFWAIGRLCWHGAQAAGTRPSWGATGLGTELWGATGCSHKVALILSLERKSH